MVKINAPSLYQDDDGGIRETTDAGVGIPRRRPWPAPHQCVLIRQQLEHGACLAAFDIRQQLEHGACLAAFDAGVHLIIDLVPTSTRHVQLDILENDDAVPGLRPRDALSARGASKGLP